MKKIMQTIQKRRWRMEDQKEDVMRKQKENVTEDQKYLERKTKKL